MVLDGCMARSCAGHDGRRGIGRAGVSVEARAYFRALCRRRGRRYPDAHAGRVVSKQWGQSVVVENRPGAGGVIASQAVATSAPDGYTLIMVASGHATNPFLYPKIPYDTFKDFTPISLLASSPNILLVRADSPFKTVGRCHRGGEGEAGKPVLCPCRQRHVDPYGRRTPEEPRQNRSQRHSLQGRRARHQRSAGRSNSDDVQQRPGIGRPVAGRTVRALAVTTATRAPFLPDVPSMSETVPGYDTGVWWGLLGPGGMPADVLAKLSHDFVAALNTDAVKERLGKLGALPIGSTPQEFDAQDPCRLRQMGADHQGRRNEGRMMRWWFR